MLRLITTAFLSLTVLIFLPFNAAAFDSRLVRELIIKSGMRKQVERVPQDVLEGIQQEQLLKQEPAMKTVELVAAIESAFNPKRMEARLQDEIGNHLSTEELRDVLNWLDSPLGMKLTRLEEKTASPAFKQETARALQQLLKDPGAAQRLHLLQRLEAALHSTETAVDTILNIQIAVISANSAMAPAQPCPTFEQIAERVYKNRPQVRQVISQQVIGGFLYAYRDVPTGDLETYIAFIESPTGSRYHQVALKAFSDALILSGKNFGEAVSELIAGQADRSSI